MARLLRDKDYFRVIQSDNLDQITESNNQTKIDVEQAAQAEMISYLVQRYIITQIFTNTTSFSLAAQYFGKNLVEYSEPAYNIATTYVAGNRASINNNIYSSIAGNAPGPFNIAQWTFITENQSLYYVTLPQPEYNPITQYSIGNSVWYNDKVYTALVATKGVYPDTSTVYWGVGVPYSITNILPTVSASWTKGDNRNQEIVMFLMDIVLYHLHSRINPRNIPELRKDRYDGNRENQTLGAIGWLKKVASGDVTACLPNISPAQGLSIRWGDVNGSGDITIQRSSNLY